MTPVQLHTPEPQVGERPRRNEPAKSHFASIDMLRAVLAWIVVAAHVIYYTGLLALYPKLEVINRIGDWSVTVFIIVSGFVIIALPLRMALWRVETAISASWRLVVP